MYLQYLILFANFFFLCLVLSCVGSTLYSRNIGCKSDLVCHIGFLFHCLRHHRHHFNLARFKYWLYTPNTHKLHLQASLMLCLIICKFIPKMRKKFILLFAISPCRMHVCRMDAKNIYYRIKSNQVSTHRKQTIEFLPSITSSAATARTFAGFCAGFFCMLFIIYTYIVWGTLCILFVQSPSEWWRQSESYNSTTAEIVWRDMWLLSFYYVHK